MGLSRILLVFQSVWRQGVSCCLLFTEASWPRDNQVHLVELRIGIQPIDLVVVNLYPVAQTVAKPGVTLGEALENIDIGGPTLIRAAATNFPQVVVIVSPERYAEVLKLLQENNGMLPEQVRRNLALEAFGHTAQYDTIIYGYLAKQRLDPVL